MIVAPSTTPNIAFDACKKSSSTGIWSQSITVGFWLNSAQLQFGRQTSALAVLIFNRRRGNDKDAKRHHHHHILTCWYFCANKKTQNNFFSVSRLCKKFAYNAKHNNIFIPRVEVEVKMKMHYVSCYRVRAFLSQMAICLSLRCCYKRQSDHLGYQYELLLIDIQFLCRRCCSVLSQRLDKQKGRESKQCFLLIDYYR